MIAACARQDIIPVSPTGLSTGAKKEGHPACLKSQSANVFTCRNIAVVLIHYATQTIGGYKTAVSALRSANITTAMRTLRQLVLKKFYGTAPCQLSGRFVVACGRGIVVERMVYPLIDIYVIIYLVGLQGLLVLGNTCVNPLVKSGVV